MMATKLSKSHKSIKHQIIDKDNTRTVAAVALATFIVIFSLFAVRALFSQSLYHGRVVAEKETALTELKQNKESIETLKQSYTEFVGEQTNILGGNSTGSGPIDGDNARLVLDSLPSLYDYPALSSSFEKILKDGGYKIGSIGGSGDTISVETGDEIEIETGINPEEGVITAEEVPYSLSFTSTRDRAEDFLITLERSTRPMYVDSLQIQVGEKTLVTNVVLHTYFAQGKSFELGFKEIK